MEKLTSGTHSVPRNLGRFEIMYSPFTGKIVPPGLLFNWKNLTSASIVVCSNCVKKFHIIIYLCHSLVYLFTIHYGSDEIRYKHIRYRRPHLSRSFSVSNAFKCYISKL